MHEDDLAKMAGGGDIRAATAYEIPPHIREAIERYSLEAHADVQQLDSAFQARFADADWQTGLALIENYSVERFDLMAERLLPLTIHTISDQYLDLLEGMVFKFLLVALKPLRLDLREDVYSRIRLKLGSRKLWWSAKAKRRYLAPPQVRVQTLTGIVAGKQTNDFGISPDYRSVSFSGETFTLSKNQGAMLKVLYEAHLSKYPDVEKLRLLGAIENETSEVRDTWKSSRLWKTLIVSERRGTYRLNIQYKPARPSQQK
jgi:hypothetical protein